MWRTAFGKPVVPELKTSTASPSSSTATSPSGDRLRPNASCRTLPVLEVGDLRGRQVSEERRFVGIFDHRVHRCGQIDGVTHLQCSPGRAQEDRRRTELARGHDHDQEFGAVRRHHRHPLTGTHAPGGEVAGEGIAQFVDVAKGPALVSGDDRLSTAIAGRRRLQARMHGGGARHGNIVLRIEIIVNRNDLDVLPP